MTIRAGTTTITLPEPEFGNNIRSKTTVSVIQMKDGSTSSYVRRRSNVHEYSFILSREKARELASFITNNGSEIWFINISEVVGYYIDNPSEIAMLQNDRAEFRMQIDESITTTV